MMKLPFLVSIALFTTVCHGLCLRQPIDVTVDELITNPQRFNGKLIATTGYYALEHHGGYFCADAKTAVKGANGAWRIHLDFKHASLPPEMLRRVQAGYVKLVGTFEYRDMKPKRGADGTRVIAAGFGWMNVYDKQIMSIATFEKISSLDSK